MATEIQTRDQYSSTDCRCDSIGVTSANRHSSGNSLHRNNLRKRRLSFGARTEEVFRKKYREATRRVHSTIRIKIQQVPLNLTCSEGNAAECKPRKKGLRQLNIFEPLDKKVKDNYLIFSLTPCTINVTWVLQYCMVFEYIKQCTATHSIEH